MAARLECRRAAPLSGVAARVMSPPISRRPWSRTNTRAGPVVLACLAVAGLAGGRGLSAQVAPLPSAPAGRDSAANARAAREAVADARDAQARFERQRRQWSPVARNNTWVGGSCDETVGRLCWRYDEGSDWWPRPEDLPTEERRI